MAETSSTTTAPGAAASVRSGPAPAGAAFLAEEAALRLVLSTALFGLVAALVLAAGGAHESRETQLWIVAFAVAVPGGFALSSRALARLTGPADAIGSVAAGLWALIAGLAILKSGDQDALHHLVLALACAVALALPFLVAGRVPAAARTPAAGVAVAGLAVLALLFVLKAQRNADIIVPAVVLAAVAAALVVLADIGRPGVRHGLDAVVVVLLLLVVAHFPNILDGGYNVVHHHGFFLGPANDVANGRAMLDGAWSQYGVALFDALRVAFWFVPLSYGGMALLLAAVTAAEFVLVYAVLRLAGASVPLAAVAMVVVVFGQIFAQIDSYVVYPSASALRFGLPFVVVAVAVIAARRPEHARRLEWVQLGLIAIAAAWSFETFIYSVAAYGSIRLVEELAAGPGWARRVGRHVVRILAAAAAAVVAFSLATIVYSGGVHWGPYIDYLRLYSVDEFSQLPMAWFSPGAVAAAAIFFSAVVLVWLARDRPWAVPAPTRAGLAGFTGAAIAEFTYYLGRSDLNNVRHVLLPVAAMATLWIVVLLRGERRPGRAGLIGATAILLAGGFVVAQAWPLVRLKWHDTAFALLIPVGANRPADKEISFADAVRREHDQPVFDPRAPGGVALLDNHLPKGAPALVITSPDLTTEILIRAKRRNILPLANPLQDDLLDSATGRTVDAARRIGPGGLLLTSPAPPPGGMTPLGMPAAFTRAQAGALAVLQRKYRFTTVDSSTEGLLLVRLDPR